MRSVRLNGTVSCHKRPSNSDEFNPRLFEEIRLQKSRADDGDFCDMFCTTSPRLSSIESVVFQPIDNYTQKFLMTGHRSIEAHGPEREIMGVARSLIYRMV